MAAPALPLATGSACRHMLFDKGPDIGRRMCATETTLFLALMEKDDRRKAAHPVVTGQLHVFSHIDFELGQPYGTIIFRDDPLQHRGDHPAG